MVEFLPCKHCGWVPNQDRLEKRHDGFGRTPKRITHVCGLTVYRTHWHNLKRDIADEWNGRMR